MANDHRIESVDFWRGAVMVAVMIDHIPGNLLEFLTPKNFGFSDAAEAFVFLSGISVGTAYYRKAERSGTCAMVRACLARALRIYRFHLAMSLGAIAIFGLAYLLCGHTDLIEADGRGIVFRDPARGGAGVLLLGHQLGYFNILPMYVALMLWAPVAIVLARAHPLPALIASGTLYAGANALGLSLPNWPEPGGWFFNPLAWQLLFTMGIVVATRMRARALPAWPALRVASVAIVAAGAVVMTDAGGMLPGLCATAFTRLDIGKQDLGLVRLAHFLALAYCISTTPWLASLNCGIVGAALRRLGHYSLQAFAAGSLLCALGQATLLVVLASSGSTAMHAVGIVYTLAAIAVLLLLARALDRGRQPGRPVRQAVAPAILGSSPMKP